MISLRQTFDDRVQEIESYLDFLSKIDASFGEGIPRLWNVTPTQLRILYSSFYIQFYNLVESTISQCIDSVCQSVINRKLCPSDLPENLCKEWVRTTAQTHKELTGENRLTNTIGMLNKYASNESIVKCFIAEKVGGNWDDKEIERFAQRIGITLTIEKEIHTGIKHSIKYGKSALAEIKELRNQLARGSISFAECGTDTTITDLNEIKDKVVPYLMQVVSSFEKWIVNDEHLFQSHRRTSAKP